MQAVALRRLSLALAVLLLAAPSAGAATSTRARVALQPGVAAPGATIRIAGTGFPPHALVTVTLGRLRLARGRSHRRGRFAATIHLPPTLSPGVHRLLITTRRTHISAPFTVSARPAPPAAAPAPATPGVGSTAAPRAVSPPPPPPPAPPSSGTVAAAGDIACDPGSVFFNGGNGDAANCAQARTAALIPPADAVLSLGDNQYENGTLPKFLGSYDLTWGRFKPIIDPVPGNHDYAAGYYDYFGPRAGTPGEGWYSFDLGSWHILALNSECDVLPAGTCASGGAEEAFVRQDLAAHPTACTLAFWHEPRFSSGSAAVVNAAAMAPIWNDLEHAGADLVLSAHKHFYERFAPLSASGGVDAAQGMRELIVGTGGDDHAGGTSPVAAGSQIRNDTAFGVLKLTLDDGGYSWHFVPEAGSSFTDSGTGTCH